MVLLLPAEVTPGRHAPGTLLCSRVTLLGVVPPTGRFQLPEPPVALRGTDRSPKIGVLSPGPDGAVRVLEPRSTSERSAGTPPACTPSEPNILVVVLDDVGVEQLAAYGEGADPAHTPNIDRLAAEGVLFRNAYSNPLCSPTRAGLQTGRYAFRHGIGNIIQPNTGPALSHSELTLPELLDVGTRGRYAHALFGKWHLGNNSNGLHDAPNLAGYGHYSGSLFNVGQIGATSYFHWQKTVDGSVFFQSGYITSDTIDDTIAWVDQQRQRARPWMAVVAFHAPHAPFHAPPAHLTTMDLSQATDLMLYQAMLEAADTEFGRLVRYLEGTGQYDDTTVVLLGDNGTPKAVAVAPIPPEHAKGTLYEGGVNVPLIVRSPLVAVPGSQSAAFVSVVDVFATVADVAGVDLAQATQGIAIDSRSLVPYLRKPDLASQRPYGFAEIFSPLGAQHGAIPPAAGTSTNNKVLRDERYKLFWRTVDNSFEMYDLRVDPYEHGDLLPGGLTPEEQERFFELRDQIRDLVGS